MNVTGTYSHNKGNAMLYKAIITSLCAQASDPAHNSFEDGKIPDSIKELLDALIEGMAVLTVPTVSDAAQEEMIRAMMDGVLERGRELRAKFIEFAAREGIKVQTMNIH